jgi:ABC-type uncharacterized transport system fused permease/ATPase subunit
MFFSDYSFRVHHLVNQDDRHLLAHAMAIFSLVMETGVSVMAEILLTGSEQYAQYVLSLYLCGWLTRDQGDI